MGDEQLEKQAFDFDSAGHKGYGSLGRCCVFEIAGHIVFFTEKQMQLILLGLLLGETDKLKELIVKQHPELTREEVGVFLSGFTQADEDDESTERASGSEPEVHTS